TWRQYAPLFREYSTASISPELLAALAQIESASNPLASTYWRWRLTWNLFAVYQPASSGVGMYQMTDAAFAEAQRYCILHHAVVENGCASNGLYSRVVLCGAGPAKAFARRGFHLLLSERCGDHDVAAYLAQIMAMKLKFLRLAAES